MKIAVAGCVAQAEGKELLSRAGAVDVVVGPQSYHRLPELLSAGGRDRRDGLSRREQVRRTSRSAPRPKQVSAFLTVQEGCDKFCTFCVVPYTRGAEFSRPVEKIVAEAEALAARGVKEIMLLGQNVNAYHGAGPDGATWPLARLLERLSEIEGIERLRYVTSHPRDMSDDLIAAHRDLPKLMPYLHLPVQSGSDRVLDAMNRKHDRDFYLRLVERLRRARPDLALSGDFIVGFPGETRRGFRGHAAARRGGRLRAAPIRSNTAPRPGTPAAEMEQVPEDGEGGAARAPAGAARQASSRRSTPACAG